MEKNAEKIRSDVSEAYARAVTEPKGSCCGSSIPKGVTAQLAGYSEAELGSVPQGAAVNSFGCGNPLAFSEVQPGQVVLDLGSGAGLDLLLAANKVGPSGKVIGIDMTDPMIEAARKHIAAAGVTQVEVRKGLIEALPVESGSVDWVISNCVINLSPEKEKVFAEIHRVLKPGGRVAVSDIVVEELPQDLRDNTALHCACIGGAISEAQYLDNMKRAGLVDAGVKEKFAYEASQIAELAESELEMSTDTCCGPTKDQVQSLSRSLEGKIWSAKFTARKP